MSNVQFINKSNNTVYLSSIDMDIPFMGNSVQEISLDDIKKSKGFRVLLEAGKFEIVKCGDSLFERNLLKMQKKSENIEIKENDFSSPSGKIEVKIRGSVYEAGGYAKVNRNLAFGLYASNVKVQVEAISKMKYGLDEQEAKLLSELQAPVSQNAIVVDSIIPSMTDMGFGKYKILYTTLEASSMPEQFVEIMNMYNEIWVVSDFCKEVISKYNIKPKIYVVPPGININLYHEDCKPYEFNPPLKDFVFISVFGWGYRKGYDVLLRAYLEEFDGDEDVSLLLRSGLPYDTGRNNPVKDTVAQFIKNYGGDNPPHIARCARSFTDSEMPSIYKACNAYVLFTRGEGFGLPYAEASLCGLPVIATNHSGQTMFLKKDNSFLIDIDKLINIQAGMMAVHYWDGQEFPMLTSEKVIKDARNAMRYVYENEAEARAKNESLKLFLAENYNMGATSRLAGQRLVDIWRKIS